MKNVNKYQKKTCIFLTLEEYEEVLTHIFGTTIVVHTDLDGIWYETCPSRADMIDDNFENSINNHLAKHYDVKEVTSVHADDCEKVGIWIAYKE